VFVTRIFFASGIDMSVPVACSSPLYSRAGAIFDPSRDIVQAQFRSEGIGPPPLLSTDDQKKVVLASVTSLSGALFPVFVNFIGIFMHFDFIQKISLIPWRVLSTINPATRNMTSELDPKTYFGGIWSSVDLKKYRAYRKDHPIDYTSNDVAGYHHDLSLLDDFLLPSVEGDGVHDGANFEGLFCF